MMSSSLNLIECQQEYGRFPFFPIPEHGETVYSLFCRAIERTGLPAKYIIEALTGQSRKTSLLSAFPGNIKRISESSPDGHPWADINNLISNHSAFPYFTYFYSYDQRNAVMKILTETNSCVKANMSLGLTSYRQKLSLSHPKFCFDCLKDDQMTFGFTCFHREHQLPGVGICWKHGSPLFSGCQTCSTHTRPAHGLFMAGRCKCPEGVSTVQPYEALPSNYLILRWFADQSAYMVNSGGTIYDCTRTALRQFYFQSGFSRGSLLDYVKVSNEMERKYGAEFLDWLGYPAWSGGKVSPWIGRFLKESKLTTRSPSTIYLLFIGILFESLPDFERGISCDLLNGKTKDKENISLTLKKIDDENISSGCSNCSWAAELNRLLDESGYRISTLAARIGLSPNAIAIEARKQKIRVPISSRTLAIYGNEKIDEVRCALRSGMAKIEIQKRYQVSEWTIFLIELDAPGIRDAHKLASSENLKESHRYKVRNFLANNIHTSKIDFMKAFPGSYEFMLERDKQWFNAQFSNRVTKKPTPFARKLKDRPDSLVANKVTSIVEGMLSKDVKPRWITRTGVLKQVGQLNHYILHREKFIQTDQVLNKFVETQEEFLNRKIKWAISEMIKSGQTLSVNKLRRVAGVPAPTLRLRRQYVIDTAIALGAVISGRSFFQDT